MKLYIFLIIILTGCLYKTPTDDKTSSQRPIKTHELPDEKFRQWTSIKDRWLRNEFPLCLKRYNLEMSCSGCEYIYITVELTIDGDGRLVQYKIIHENICGKRASKQIEKCFMRYFKTIVFPKELRNLTIVANLGNGLKC